MSDVEKPHSLDLKINKEMNKRKRRVLIISGVVRVTRCALWLVRLKRNGDGKRYESN